MCGWIKIQRDIEKHWIFDNAEYFKAWTVILLNVNYEDKKVVIDKQLIECKRGESLYSLSTWTKMFGISWTINKTRTFLKLLENDGMILTKGLSKTTRLTVCNYERYQDEQQTNNKQITNKQQTNNKQITTTKESKEYKEYIEGASKPHESPLDINGKIVNTELNIKPKNEKYENFNNWLNENASSVLKMKEPISEEQYEKIQTELVIEYGKENVLETLRNMHNYRPLLTNNTSAYLTLRKWLKK